MRSLRQLVSSSVVVAMAAMPLVTGMGGCASNEKEVTIAFVPAANLKSVGLHQVWERAVALGAGEEVANAWRVGDSVYVSTNMATLVRINATSGETMWETTLPETHSEIFRPAETMDGKGIVVVNRGNAFCFNKDTGAELLTKPLNISVMTDPVVVGTVLCIGGTGYYYGLYVDQLSGEKWKTAADNDMFIAQPVQVGDSLLIASRQGHVWRISADTGDWVWRDRQANGLVTGGLGADSNAVYVPAEDKRVYAFDVKTGQELWDQRLEGVLDQTVVVTKTKVLVPSTGMGVYALTQTHGDVLWLAKGGTQIGTVMSGRVWVQDSGGMLTLVSLDTGETLGSAVVPSGKILVRNSVDQQVIEVNRAGVVASYKAE